MSTPTVDWSELKRLALEASEHAYAPYSNYKVGAAGLVEDGRTVVGCNVENSSLGVTLCAECGLVSQLHLSGGGKLLAFLCVGNGKVTLPCGRCRQLLAENGGAKLLVACPDGSIKTLEELLPGLVDGPNQYL